MAGIVKTNPLSLRPAGRKEHLVLPDILKNGGNKRISPQKMIDLCLLAGGSIDYAREYRKVASNFARAQKELGRFGEFKLNQSQDVVLIDPLSPKEYIPSNLTNVFFVFLYLRKLGVPRSAKGIDLGSGLGTVCHLGSIFFNSFDGVEINQLIYLTSRAYPYDPQRGKVTLWHGDFFDVDLSPYKIIYAKLGGRKQFVSSVQKKIEDQARKGAYVVANRVQSRTWENSILKLPLFQGSDKLKIIRNIGNLDIFQRT